MVRHFRSLHALLRHTAAVALVCVLTLLASNAQAQVHLVVDSKGSLAWWQIDPNMAHLWATTCPQEPSWRPGEGRSGGWTTEEAMNAKTLAHGFNQSSDTVHVPLYPRRRVRYVCTEAVQGQITLPDTVHWRGAHGQVTVRVKDIVTGETMRDNYQNNAILSMAVYPDIKYALDSIVNTHRRGDTLYATAMGSWTLRGVTKPMQAQIRSYPDAGGVTRVHAKMGIPVKALVSDYGVWKRSLGLGVMMDIWKTLFVGVDLVLRPESQGRIGQ
jgi:polyisoprenoid-binding protein YceI